MRSLLSLRRGLPLAAALAAFALLGPVSAQDDGFTPLFNGTNFSGWKFVLGAKEVEDPGKTFTVKGGVIAVSGSPNGYFYTTKSYKNYVLRFDWRYLKPEEGKKSTFNSGLLVHIQPPHVTWPKCIEVQGANASHGNTFAIGSKKGDPAPSKFAGKFDKTAHKEAVKPISEWNTTEVTCQDGTITVKINGKQVDSGKSNLTEGPFGFQSEGAEMEYHNIKIRETK